MRFSVQHPSFQRKKLELKSGGFLTSPSILIDGAPVDGWKGQVVARSDDDQKVPIELKKRWLDPVPHLVIDGAPVDPAPPLKWYEYVFMCIPLSLVAVGGLLGALAGLAGAYSSARVFRSELPTLIKYVLSAVISAAAVVLYLGLATVFAIVIRGCSAG